MGEMADYIIDSLYEEEASINSEIYAYMKLGEKYIIQEIKDRKFYKSDYTKLVKSILKSYKKYGKISKKQLYCIARYLVNDNRL